MVTLPSLAQGSWFLEEGSDWFLLRGRVSCFGGGDTQGWVRSNELQILDSDFREWWSLLKLKDLNFLLFLEKS